MTSTSSVNKLPRGSEPSSVSNDLYTLFALAELRPNTCSDPDLMIAIGGGGFIPARIIRTFLKVSDTPESQPRNIPIQAIGLSLYEALPDTSEEVIGKEVIRTQWLDFSTLGDKYGKYGGGLLGKRILVVDEVDDSRATLSYALQELQIDVEKQLQDLKVSEEERTKIRAATKFGIFVVHNK
jgi:hypoxanthine phosphoribosyltransferase